MLVKVQVLVIRNVGVFAITGLKITLFLFSSPAQHNFVTIKTYFIPCVTQVLIKC